MIYCCSNQKRKRFRWKTSLLRSQIDAISKKYDDWRGEMLSRLRALLKQADPAFVEAVKGKKPSRPEGVPVWSHEGILCCGDTLKNAVRLTFPKGAQMKDPHKLFHTRLRRARRFVRSTFTKVLPSLKPRYKHSCRKLWG